MLERLTAGITDENDTRIDWVKTPEEIVEGVEAVFSAVKDRAADEMDLIEDMFDLIKDAAALAGAAFELPIVLGAVGAFAPFAGIGMGLMEAAEEIKKDRSPIAFAEGVTMGVMAEPIDLIRDKFWMHHPSRNDFFPQGGQIAQYYNNGALLLGYAYGKEFQGRLAPVFWADLKRVDDQSLITHGDPTEENWGSTEWRDFYISIAVAFMKLHVREDD